MHYTGSCYCRAIKFEFDVNPTEVSTSLCHCHNCKKFSGSNYAITTKIPASVFKIKAGSPRIHESDNGEGRMIHREFCERCGGPILEFPERTKEFKYIMYGTIDNPEGLDPKGEIFCKWREGWMPEIKGITHKEEQ